MSFWDTEEEILSIDKNDRGEEIKVKKVSKKGRNYTDVRTFYPGKNDEMLAGKGISVPEGAVKEVAVAMLKSVGLEVNLDGR